MQKEYTQTKEQVLEGLRTDRQGLSAQEAEKRLREHGENRLKEAEKLTLLQRFVQQLKDPMLLILLAAAAVSAVTNILSHESFTEVIIILLVVLLNAVLGVVQESKAEAAIEALQTMTAATCKVLRDGKITVLHSADLVPGDVVLLEAGDAVPADGRLLESASLKIEEAALTGESVPVNKTAETISAEGDVPLGDRKNMVYMGSTIVYGRAVAVVTATGMDTERGVYVISVNALGSVLRDYIRPNDVILELGGKTVNNLADLQKAVQETDLKQPQTMVIFRSQKENKLTLPGNLLK